MKIETHRSKQKITIEPGDHRSLERNIRQLLANKVSGNMTGVWLLIPEYLRLVTWDMLQAWCNANEQQIEPRLALQLVNETALYVNGIRLKRTMSQKGFELANGLPFVATDAAIHNLLSSIIHKLKFSLKNSSKMAALFFFHISETGLRKKTHHSGPVCCDFAPSTTPL